MTAAPETSPRLQAAAEFYRGAFAWDVEIGERSLALVLTGGIAAFSVPFHTKNQHLFSARDAVPRGPLILTPGAPFRVHALVDASDFVIPDQDLPENVLFHRPLSKVLLPPTVGTRGAVRWLREPSPQERWLPLAAGVFSALSRPNRRNAAYRRRVWRDRNGLS
ncbi:hypothetical protein GCM10027598_84980 [Amycolatopsis oliviviridis]|uniref:AraC family transcriptional regulator n=1 Tax=Amycolatopsis oliviviridis TaxID=1471590 RepID=A0ABQ3L9Z5_9PSEU|nr:hypothetical protein [Amycolatopsis oliviviridis]GHH07771.1 hypothetical protein GCM10017790_14870 [Amycolatopsis oliviviridis]